MSFFVETEYNTISMNISSLYLHVPFCRHLCNYCDFFKYREGSEQSPTWSDYEGGLIKSFEALKHQTSELGLEIEKEFRTFYMGGGTPSLWGERGIEFLDSLLNKENISLLSSQTTLEIDPGTITEKELSLWKELGVNRFSVGLQTLNEGYLTIADRAHTHQEALETLETLRSSQYPFSADFLLGLPKRDKKRDVIAELETILSYNPEHLSLYILTVPKSYPHYSLLPTEEEIEAEYLTVSKHLQKAGFEHYEVSNFAKPGCISKHNFVYWNGESYLGFGPSATGQWRVHDQSLIRYKWNPKLEMVTEKLSEKEIKIESLYLALRTKKGFDSQLVPQALIDSWLGHSLIYKDNHRDHYCCTANGYLVVDSLIEQIFSYQNSSN